MRRSDKNFHITTRSVCKEIRNKYEADPKTSERTLQTVRSDITNCPIGHYKLSDRTLQTVRSDTTNCPIGHYKLSDRKLKQPERKLKQSERTTQTVRTDCSSFPRTRPYEVYMRRFPLTLRLDSLEIEQHRIITIQQVLLTLTRTIFLPKA